jgi:ADP-ribosylglycohydrolase
MTHFRKKLEGAIYGQAIGDAMGAPVEGWSSERIMGQFDNVRTFLPATHGNDPDTGKGYGRVTDDTLMLEALIRVYGNAQTHLDAYDYEKYLIPQIAETPVWIPEKGADLPLLDRLFWAEKYPWMRLVMNHAEPRSAGIGNVVNCGAAMYVMPVGAVNAGDPFGAYQEAAALMLAHNESYAVEASAVMAAAAAYAFSKDATLEGVFQTAYNHAHDGTRDAIRAVLSGVDPADDVKRFISKVLAAFRPYDSRPPWQDLEHPMRVGGIHNYGRPSRLHSIEELPIAFAALKYGAGDFHKTLEASVFYGADCDSIAGMACMLFGAVFGVGSLPRKLCAEVDRANKRDYAALAAEFENTIRKIAHDDSVRHAQRQHALNGDE